MNEVKLVVVVFIHNIPVRFVNQLAEIKRLESLAPCACGISRSSYPPAKKKEKKGDLERVKE